MYIINGQISYSTEAHLQKIVRSKEGLWKMTTGEGKAGGKNQCKDQCKNQCKNTQTQTKKEKPTRAQPEMSTKTQCIPSTTTPIWPLALTGGCNGLYNQKQTNFP